jgi:UDP-2,3-diacylglucosamine pyrophosphatase LpxH
VQQRYRTVFISDLHLGARGCRAAELSHFLKHIRCDRLYLVGDIIDMWRLKSRWYWPDEHNDVLRRILNHAKHGTEVLFVPGNHDDAARQFHHQEFGGVKLLPYAVHVTADGRKLLVTHGDQFDLVVQHQRWLSKLGALGYELLIALNRYYNILRLKLGKPYWSMSQAVKGKVKGACTFISRFEEFLMREAKRRGMQGVVCGHIHKAELREQKVDGKMVEYFNCGDWVESCTALVEHADGMLEIVDGLDWSDWFEREREGLDIEELPEPEDAVLPFGSMAVAALGEGPIDQRLVMR